MRPHNHTLDRQQVHRAAAEHLQAHLKFKDYKRKTSAPVLQGLRTRIGRLCAMRQGSLVTCRRRTLPRMVSPRPQPL